MKSIKNNINRARNCDSANISKTVEASIKQRRAIEFLKESDRLQSLPDELLQAANLRLKNPEATLKELVRISNEPLTVSGLNHRFKKIMEIYDPHVLGTVITNLAVLGEMFNMQIQPVDYHVEESHEE